MLKVQAPLHKENYSFLLSMGYKPEVITLAMNEAKNQSSLDEILELILNCEERYQNAIKKKESLASNPNKNIFDDLDNEKSRNRKNSNKNKSKNPKEDKPSVPKKDSYQEENNNAVNNNEPNGELDPELSKVMDEESSNYLNGVRKSLNHINSKDPRDYIACLSEHLKKLKFDTSETGKLVHRYLASGSHFTQVVDLRKRVYEVVMKVMTMKRSCEADVPEFEYMLLMSFELKVLNSKQMDIVLTSYNKFCNKMGHKQDDVLISSLEKYYAESKRPTFLSNTSSNQDQDIYLLNDYAILKCPNVTVAKKKVFEESKISDKMNGNNGQNKGKEYCVTCAEKMREIVFLPCCHFLTCPTCSTEVLKCPVCEKKVEKYLKIFWS